MSAKLQSVFRLNDDDGSSAGRGRPVEKTAGLRAALFTSSPVSPPFTYTPRGAIVLRPPLQHVATIRVCPAIFTRWRRGSDKQLLLCEDAARLAATQWLVSAATGFRSH